MLFGSKRVAVQVRKRTQVDEQNLGRNKGRGRVRKSLKRVKSKLKYAGGKEQLEG
jgi:hypothetical protein